MKTARLTAALLALTVAGCGTTTTTDPGDSPASEAPADPKDALFDAVPDRQDAAYKFDLKGGDNPMSGVMDVPNKATELRTVQSEDEFTMTMSFLVVGEQTWTKIAFKPADVPGLPKFGKKWLLLDKSKLKDKDLGQLQAESDPGNAALLVDKAESVTETSPGHFEGTTDLVAAANAELVDDKTLTALGDKAKAVPFEATVAGGNLTRMTLHVPAAGKTKAQTYAIKYSGFGATGTPAVPAAGEQTKASPLVYEMLNG